MGGKAVKVNDIVVVENGIKSCGCLGHGERESRELEMRFVMVPVDGSFVE